MTKKELPRRVQLSRAAGWRLPEGAVVVARPSRWGNPFEIGAPGVPDRATAVARYRDWLSASMADESFAEAVYSLRGKRLACWCRLHEPCHADVLAEAANSPPARWPSEENGR